MEIIETSVFTKIIQSLLADEEYRILQSELVETPDLGAIIPRSGGLRKIRWKTVGQGKRGGIRVIYYWHISFKTILLLYAYPKSKKSDLTSRQLKALKMLIEENP